MKLAEIFPSKYVKAADLQGREPTVVIAGAEVEKIGDDHKLVIYFRGKEKGLVCNRTNADSIALLYGDDTDAWIGKEITLTTAIVTFQGKSTEAVRVKRPPAPHGRPAAKLDAADRPGYTMTTLRPAEPARDEMDEEIPF